MGQLHYITNVSLDGFIEDEQGSFDWTEPDDELFAYLHELLRPLATHLYGRRLYESMAVWETDPALAGSSAANEDFAAVWQAADKVVWSTTLESVSTARTRLERSFDPAVVRELKAATANDLLIGGADLAGQALAAGVVDEVHLLVRPVVVGGGKPGLSTRGTRVDLELLEERAVGRGVAHLRYRVAS